MTVVDGDGGGDGGGEVGTVGPPGLHDEPTRASSPSGRADESGPATATLALTTDDWERIHSVVAEALACPPADRLERLRALCGDDAELLARVRRVLDGATGGPADVATPRHAGGEPRTGDLVGPYRVLGEIGRGGMGVVYLAERDDVGKRVALKLVTSWASRERMDRLLAERRILARLEHPNIAQLLDAGRTVAGVPYFAMELIEGAPIDEALERRDADLDERIDALIEVCRAVHFAHQRAVVHRDLKPSNVLLDRDGRVKLLDFGIAKIVDPSDDGAWSDLDDPGLTRTGVRLLTPAWASPEQVRGEPVTTASDVYSLGVVAYHLLSGTSPYPALRTRSEAEAAVLEHLPKPPSRRATDTPTAPGTLQPSSPRASDLDAVCLQALRKEPARRYASAAQMADDLEAYRRGLPVSAQGDSTAYRLRRFLTRHRLPVAAVLALLGFLVAWSISSGLQAERLERERDRAQLEAAKARTVTDFLVELFRLSDPQRARGEEPSARELLERGADRVATEMADEPELQIEMFEALGRVYNNLGKSDRSTELFEAALATARSQPGDRRAEEAYLLLRVAEAQLRYGEFEPAVENTRAALDLRLEVFGEAPGDDVGGELITDAREELAQALISVRRPAEAEDLLRQAIEWRETRQGPSEPLAVSYRYLGDVLSATGDDEAAFEALERSAELFAALDDPNLELHAQALIVLSRLASGLGRLDRAEGALDRAWDLTRAASFETLDPMLARVAVARSQLAQRRGALDQAEESARVAVEVTRTVWGDEHPKLGMTILNLANILSETDDPAAEPLYEEAIAIMGRRLSPRHPHLAAVRLRQAEYRVGQGRVAEALESAREVLEIRREAYGPDHVRTAQAQLLIAECLIELGREDEARPLLDEATATFERLEAAESLERAGIARTRLAG